MDKALFKALIKGFLSYVPGAVLVPRREGGGANSARYCYSVWLRHLILARQNGMKKIPDTVAELGPGDSLGVGLSALLSGVHAYHAFDVVGFIRLEQNQKILSDLIKLFREQSPVPDEQEFPHLFPRLKDYSFPYEILDNDILASSLAQDRVSAIQDALKTSSLTAGNAGFITYSVPWDSEEVLRENHVDLIISQAVLEHVDDLEHTYSSMYRWLKSGGYISNEIDFKSHGTARDWNGHWRYNDFMWRIIRGKRAYFLNREPLSTHIRQLDSAGFDLTFISKTLLPTPHSPAGLSKRFTDLDNDDLSTSSAYLLAYKK